jgi:hypothetical protein
MVEQKSYDLKVRHKKANGRYVVTVIPPEDFLISATRKPRGCRVQGPLAAQDALRSGPDGLRQGQGLGHPGGVPQRDAGSSRPATCSPQHRDATDKSMELVDYHECFMMIDVDGDGVAEMVRACMPGRPKR